MNDISVRDAFGGLVAQAARRWRRAVDAELRVYGLTEATWLPLLHLSRAGNALRQTDLAKALTLDTSSVVRLLDTLVANGYATRTEDHRDRRAKMISLTPRAYEAVKSIEASSSLVREIVLSDIPDCDLITATAVLETVLAALTTYDLQQ